MNNFSGKSFVAGLILVAVVCGMLFAAGAAKGSDKEAAPPCAGKGHGAGPGMGGEMCPGCGMNGFMGWAQLLDMPDLHAKTGIGDKTLKDIEGLHSVLARKVDEAKAELEKSGREYQALLDAGELDSASINANIEKTASIQKSMIQEMLFFEFTARSMVTKDQWGKLKALMPAVCPGKGKWGKNRLEGEKPE